MAERRLADSTEAIQARRLKVLRFRLESGLRVENFASVLHVSVATIERDLMWIRKRWSRQYRDAAKFDAGAALGELLGSYETAGQLAMQQFRAGNGDAGRQGKNRLRSSRSYLRCGRSWRRRGHVKTCYRMSGCSIASWAT